MMLAWPWQGDRHYATTAQPASFMLIVLSKPLLLAVLSQDKSSIKGSPRLAAHQDYMTQKYRDHRLDPESN